MMNLEGLEGLDKIWFFS